MWMDLEAEERPTRRVFRQVREVHLFSFSLVRRGRPIGKRREKRVGNHGRATCMWGKI